MRWPLRVQIALPYAILMVVVLATVSFLNALVASRLSQRQIEQQLASIAKTLLDSNFPLSESVLKQVSGLTGAEFVLASESGSEPAIGSSPVARFLQNLPESHSVTHLEFGSPVKIDNERFFHLSLDMSQRTSRAEPLVLHIFYPEHGLLEAQRQAVYPSMLVGVLAVITSCVLGVVIASRVSWPIRSVINHVSRLPQADSQLLLVPEKNDEIRDLVLAVNQLAEQLDDMRLAIRRSERLALLGQLSGGIAHHLRNNVTGARIAVQLHQRHCDENDAESLQVALRQLSLTEEHLMRLLTAGGQTPEPRRVPRDIIVLAREVSELLGPTYRHRQIRLELVADEKPCCSSVDAEQLRSLLMALLLNAAEAAGPGGWVRLEIASDTLQRVVLRVLDSGPGPSQEIVPRLFEAFATDKREGIGLGLAVGLQIARSHGGDLRLVPGSVPTCFELVLPGASAQANVSDKTPAGASTISE